MSRQVLLGRVLVGAGLAGLLATVLGTVVGVRMLGRLDATLDDSVQVTATTLEALAGTVELAEDALRQTTTTLRSTATTAVRVRDATDATAAVLEGAAEVTSEEVAGSLRSVQDTLPSLIQVAAVIDDTLRAVDVLPLGPSYDPEVAFDDALRDIEAELVGLPEALEEEAELLGDGADRLRDVSSATGAVTTDLRVLAGTLQDAGDLLTQLEDASDEAAAILGDGTSGLVGDLRLARVLLAVAGAAAAIGQLVPLLAGLGLARPDLAARLLADREAE